MNLDFQTVSLLLILAGFLGVIIALILAYLRTSAQLATFIKAQQQTKEKTFNQAEEILTEAHQEALSTIEQANQKATQMVKVSGKFAEEQQQSLEKQLRSASQTELTTYSAMLRKSQTELLSSINEVSDELQRTAESEVTKFRQELVKATTETQELFTKQLQTELAATATDVTAYKQQLLAKAQTQMFDVVQQVVQDVLHKSLTKTEHEALILEALEEAKQHHVI